jgi:hypothetical protein
MCLSWRRPRQARSQPAGRPRRAVEHRRMMLENELVRVDRIETGSEAWQMSTGDRRFQPRRRRTTGSMNAIPIHVKTHRRGTRAGSSKRRART